jgi:hypothetical protein
MRLRKQLLAIAEKRDLQFDTYFGHDVATVALLRNWVYCPIFRREERNRFFLPTQFKLGNSGSFLSAHPEGG